MNDQELAEALVAAGIGRSVKHIGNRERRFLFEVDNHDYEVQTYAEDFVRDPRVAVAAMKKCSRVRIDLSGDQWVVWVNWATEAQVNNSLERAICLACVETIKNE